MRYQSQILSARELNKVTEFQNLDWESYRGAKVLIYGGTGFIGTWLTSALAEASTMHDLKLEITVVTRNANLAQAKFSETHLENIALKEHDFSLSRLEEQQVADFIFHGATPTRAETGSIHPDKVLDGSVNAALHAISCRSSIRPLPSVTHLSSGIIYGPQDMKTKHRSEDDSSKSAVNEYAKSKLLVDDILFDAHNLGLISYQSPRLFAFTGPLLQLDAHFAIGNFLRDGLTGQPISINGNPKTIRSYMYPADLVVSLLAVATQDKYQNINIGSDVPISMFDLANLISRMTENSGVKLANNYSEPTNYVPSITNLRSIIPDYKLTNIEDSIENWINWLRS